MEKIIENLPAINRRNFNKNLSDLNEHTTNFNNLKLSCNCKRLPNLNKLNNLFNCSSYDDNLEKNINTETNKNRVNFKKKKIKLISLKKKKKEEDTFLASRKNKIAKLDELEDQKIKKIYEKNEEFKQLEDKEKQILLEYEKEKKNYQDEISIIRKEIKETLDNFEKLKSEKEIEIENLNIEILKNKSQLISIEGLNVIIENINKNSLTYEEIIKDICAFGILIKNEIYKFKAINDNFEDKISGAINNNHNLEILSNMLNTKGINDELKQNYKDKNLPYFFLKFLLLDNFIGEKMSFKFNLSKFKCEKIKTVLEEQIKFSDYIKTIINSNFKIAKEKIIINNFRGEQNEMKCDIYFTSHKFEDYHIKFINNIYKLIDIKENFIKTEFLRYERFEGEFDEQGDNLDGGWGEEKKIIGGREYDPPKGYIGIGLNINKYGNDKTWLGTCNAEGEWPIAYHGVGGHLVYNKARSIIKNNLVAGNGNALGDGVYFGREIRVADEYAKYSQDLNKYYIVFMCRVNPKKLKIVKNYPEYWLLPGNNKGDYIRPYRLLIKEKY